MTRRTYYLPESAAAALDEAIAVIQAETAGRVTKHEALAALIYTGTDRASEIAAELRVALLRDLHAARPSETPANP